MPVPLIGAATLAIGAAGLYMQYKGQQQQQQAAQVGAQETVDAQTKIINDEQATEQQRNLLMHLEAKRKQTELLRSAQKVRALSLATATSQGAGVYGGNTGLLGSFADTQSQARTQAVSIGQNLGIGDAIFGINQQLSQDKISLAQAQGKAAIASSQGAATASLGGALLGGASLIGKIGSVITPSFGNTNQQTASTYNPGLIGSLS
jgi:hypothetical protein